MKHDGDFGDIISKGYKLTVYGASFYVRLDDLIRKYSFLKEIKKQEIKTLQPDITFYRPSETRIIIVIDKTRVNK